MRGGALSTRKYGTVTLDKDGYWDIECEPHVALRIKRVFSRASGRAAGKVRLKATDDVCKDLQWFMQRYPMDVKPQKVLDDRAAKYDQIKELSAGLIEGRVSPEKFDLAIPARDYQRVAASLVMANRGLLLADDLGTGKTCSAICVMTNPEARPALVVTLTHLPSQWEAEINKFAPDLKTHVIKKGTPYDVRYGPNSKKSKQMTIDEVRQMDLTEPDSPGS